MVLNKTYETSTVRYMTYETSQGFLNKISEPKEVFAGGLRNDFYATELKIVSYESTKPFKFGRVPFLLRVYMSKLFKSKSFPWIMITITSTIEKNNVYRCFTQFMCVLIRPGSLVLKQRFFSNSVLLLRNISEQFLLDK